jgi:hypothetical protein
VYAQQTYTGLVSFGQGSPLCSRHFVVTSQDRA